MLGSGRGLVGTAATHLGQSSLKANKIGSLTALDKIPGPDLMISLAVCHTFEMWFFTSEKWGKSISPPEK